MLNNNNFIYLLDSQNKFILGIDDYEKLTLLDLDIDFCVEYEDFYIKNLENVLKKYYHLRSLGVEYVYNYSY